MDRIRVLIAAAVVVALALGAGAYLLSRDDQAPTTGLPATTPAATVLTSDEIFGPLTAKGDERGVYWLGANLGGTRPYLRRTGQGRIVEPLVVYTPPNKPAQARLFVRPLAAGHSGFALLEREFAAGKPFAVPLGRAVVLERLGEGRRLREAAIVQTKDKKTLIEILIADRRIGSAADLAKRLRTHPSS